MFFRSFMVLKNLVVKNNSIYLSTWISPDAYFCSTVMYNNLMLTVTSTVIYTVDMIFHFIAFALRLSGLGFEGFWLFLELQLLPPFHCLRFKNVGFRLCRIFFLFLDLQLLFQFYCLWFKAVGSRLWRIFFLFRLAAFFSILLPLV